MSPSVTFSVAQQIGANPYFYQKKKKKDRRSHTITYMFDTAIQLWNLSAEIAFYIHCIQVGYV